MRGNNSTIPAFSIHLPVMKGKKKKGNKRHLLSRSSRHFCFLLGEKKGERMRLPRLIKQGGGAGIQRKPLGLTAHRRVQIPCPIVSMLFSLEEGGRGD